jgi:hypothetical protein
MRTMMLGSYAHTERMMREADAVVLPAVERFGLLDFEALDAIAAAGAEAAEAAMEVVESSLTCHRLVTPSA